MAAGGRPVQLQEHLLGHDLRVRATGSQTAEATHQQHQQHAQHHYAESLDYELPVNSVSLTKQQRQAAEGERRHLYGYSGSTLTKVVATLLSGLAIGLTAAALQLLVDFSTHHRNRLVDALLSGGGTGGLWAGPPAEGAGPAGLAAAAAAASACLRLLRAFGALLGVGLAAVLLTTLVVHYWAPKAAGGGVALVMALLNGNAIHGLLSGRVYVTKLLGTAAARLAGLALGMEGPMIHLGTVVASIVCHAEHVLYRWLNLHRRGRLGKLEQEALAAGFVPGGGAEEDFLFSNADHRELVSAGAAAGLAAAFGAPIGGVLFALEEATSVWSRKLAWRCFLCASVACFSMAQLHPRMNEGMLSFSSTTRLTNLQWLIQGPPLIVASACGGLLGSAFNMMKRSARGWRRRRPGIWWRLAEATGVVAITAAALVGLPALFGTCLQLPDKWNASDVMRYTCPEGQYNDLATGLMGSAVWVIRSLLSLGSEAEPVNNRLCSLAQPCYYTAASLGVLVVSYLLLFFLASNLIMPGGLFMPCILIGSAFGALLALLLLEVMPPELDIQPGVYAVVCATAMLGAVFRSSISLVVIVVEGTRGIELLFGVILAVIVSNWVAHHLHPDGLYEAELHGENGQEVFYLRQEPPHALRNQTAESIMASPVVGLDGVVRVSAVLRVLRRTTHNGFPVLAPYKGQGQPASAAMLQRLGASGSGCGEGGGGCGGYWGHLDDGDNCGSRGGRTVGRLQGLVLRSQLLVLLRHGAFCDERGRYQCSLARRAAGAFEEALSFEMQAAAQASSSWYRRQGGSRGGGGGGGRGRGRLGAPSMLGLLGPATSLGLAGVGFPSLDASRGTSSICEAEVLDAAAAATAAQLREGDHEPYLNLSPFMNLAPMTVRPQTPAATVHHLFLSLSLRHLCVVDSRCRCVGVITRKDLDHAAGRGWWRSTDIAPSPHQSPRGVPEGTSPSAASSIWSHSDSLVRALAIPARRVVTALQQRLSPAPANYELMREAQAREEGSAGQRRPPSGRTQRQGSVARGVPLAGAAAVAAAADAAAEPLLNGSGSSLGGPGSGGLGTRLLHHSISAPTQMMLHSLEQAAWEDEERGGAGGAGGGALASPPSIDCVSPERDVEQP